MIELLADGRIAVDFSTASTMRDRVLLSLNTRRGSLITQPAFGSELHQLKRVATSSTAGRAEQMVRKALKWMVDQGMIWDLSVSVTISDASHLIISIDARSTGEPINLTTWIPIPQR